LQGATGRLIVAGKRQQADVELGEARERLTELKKRVKAADKQCVALREARKQARRAAAQARERLASSERKYEKALLADRVEREKQADLAAHSPTSQARALDPGSATAMKPTAALPAAR
jgi:chromosome segregation ATPase